jgi:hypothetical protein
VQASREDPAVRHRCLSELETAVRDSWSFVEWQPSHQRSLRPQQHQTHTYADRATSGAHARWSGGVRRARAAVRRCKGAHARPFSGVRRTRVASPTAAGAHVWRACDPGVVPATSSEHRVPACDPAVVGGHRQRTRITFTCCPVGAFRGGLHRPCLDYRPRSQRTVALHARLSHTAASMRLRRRWSTARKIRLWCAAVSKRLRDL